MKTKIESAENFTSLSSLSYGNFCTEEEEMCFLWTRNHNMILFAVATSFVKVSRKIIEVRLKDTEIKYRRLCESSVFPRFCV